MLSDSYQCNSRGRVHADSNSSAVATICQLQNTRRGQNVAVKGISRGVKNNSCLELYTCAVASPGFFCMVRMKNKKNLNNRYGNKLSIYEDKDGG